MVYVSVRRLAASILGRQVETYMYRQTGDPCKVLQRTTVKLKDRLDDNEVLVKLLAAPVNPSDINIIQGIYPVRPPLPAVAGNEGVAEVLEVGAAVKALSVGDRVIPRDFGWGTWKTHGVSKEKELIRISREVPIISAATLAVNGCTAYRLLRDFVTLKPGDIIVQNGANSSVGQAVIQLAAHMSIQTVNIIRQRPNFDEVASQLKNLGAKMVISDESLRTIDRQTLVDQMSHAPRLALNCVSGKSTAELCRLLSDNGVLVTYGGMSKMPMMIPSASVIFNNVTLRGFWLSRWNADNTSTQHMIDMWNELSDLVISKKLKPPQHAAVEFSQLPQAIAKSMGSMPGAKQIIVY